jgi:hypothetical protein
MDAFSHEIPSHFQWTPLVGTSSSRYRYQAAPFYNSPPSPRTLHAYDESFMLALKYAIN